VSPVSGNGRYVAFASDASNLVDGDTNAASDVFVLDREERTMRRVSVSSSGAQANAGSIDPAMSKNGRFIAFQSAASNLVEQDTNGQSDVFVHDRDADGDGSFSEPGNIETTVRVSTASRGEQTNGDSFSYASTISDDGRFVAFASLADNLVPNDNNAACPVGISNNPLDVDDLCAPPQPFSGLDAFVHDRDADGDGNFYEPGNEETTERVSLSWDGQEISKPYYDPFLATFGGDYAVDGTEPISMSADGRFVVFSSFASELVQGDTNQAEDVFVRDRDADHDGNFTGPGNIQTTKRVSLPAQGESDDGTSTAAWISATGRYVTFVSTADLTGDNSANSSQIFVRDLVDGTTSRVSLARFPRCSGKPGYSGLCLDSPTYERPTISGDGRFVAFASDADDLVDGDTNGCSEDVTGGTCSNGADGRDIFVVDRDADGNGVFDDDPSDSLAIIRASVSSSGRQADGPSFASALSRDGRCVSFTSLATNLVSADNNATSDVFLDCATETSSFDSKSSRLWTDPFPLGDTEDGFKSAEPTVDVDSNGNVYVTAIHGLPGGTSLWRSRNGGESFEPLPDSERGIPPGGGDADLTIDPDDGSLYLADLGAADTTVWVSRNGRDWSRSTTGTPAQDRPWIASPGGGQVYVATHQHGRGIELLRSTDGGSTFLPWGEVASDFERGRRQQDTSGCICIDLGPSPTIEAQLPTDPVGDAQGFVDPNPDQNYCICPSGNLIAEHNTDTDEDHLGVIYATQKGSVEFSGGPGQAEAVISHVPGADTLESFPTIANAGGNNLVATWMEQMGNGAEARTRIQISSSNDWGKTWLTPRTIVQGGTSVFPWVAASGSHVVVTMFHTESSATPETVAPEASWYETYVESDDGGATFTTPNRLDPQAPVKTGPICTHGEDLLGESSACSAGNRELGDFQSVAMDAEGNAYAAWARVTDAQGNTEIRFARQKLVPDTTAPSVSVNGKDSCDVPGNPGWCLHEQTAGFTATDAGTGVSSPCAASPGDTCDFSRSTTTNGIEVTIGPGEICDAAGNCAVRSVTAGPYSIDSAPPTLAPTIANPVQLHAIVEASPGARDPAVNGFASGIESAGCDAVDTSTPGIHTIACFASDMAGNFSAAWLTYVVEYRVLGFFSPRPSTEWRRGQTVPVKIAVSDANAVRISDAQAQALLEPTCRVTFSVSGAQTKAPVCMKYDSAADQFTFNWKLESTAAGPATITVTLAYPLSTTTTLKSESIQIT
jgi:hypothetical protein